MARESAVKALSFTDALGGAVGFQGDAVVTVEVEGHGVGKGDLSSSSLELSKSPKALELRGDDMLGAGPSPE